MQYRNPSLSIMAAATLLVIGGCASPRSGGYLGERVDDPPQLSPFNQPLNGGQQDTGYRGLPLLFGMPSMFPNRSVEPDGMAGITIPPPYRSRFHSGGPLGGPPGNFVTPQNGGLGGIPVQPAPLGTTPPLPRGIPSPLVSPTPQLGQPTDRLGTESGTPRTYEKPVPTYPDPTGEPLNGPQLGPEQTIPQRPGSGELAAPMPATPSESDGPSEAPEFDPARQSLVLSVNDPQQVMLGETADFEIVIRNPYDVAVENVVVECRFDDGFSFSAAPDRALRQRLGSLGVSETRTIDLALSTDRPGTHCADFTLTADGRDTSAEQRCVDVIDPDAVTDGVTVELLGPSSRNAGGRLECVLTIENRTDEEVSGIVATLRHDGALEPREVSAGAEQSTGQMDWDLGLLRVGERVQIQVEFACPTASEQACIAAEVAGRDLVTLKRELCASIQPRPALDVSVADSRDPVPVGETTTYLVTVTNRGLEPLSDLRLDVELEGGLEIIPRGQGVSEVSLLDAPTNGPMTATFHVSGPIAPDDSRNVRVDVRGVRVGSGLLSVTATEMSTDRQVTAEEPTVINPPLLDASPMDDLAGGE